MLTAVRTTGIYCRPGCGAPTPRPENTSRFQLAAAAEAAGFRACHRCRPYRLPEGLSWDQPELVCRAVRMILDGALDRAGEVELGARLGISARHLRRLFADHLGVTPDGLARSARAHFARRLLDDTDLSIAQVASAAGFGSIRQFNRSCQAIFHDSPRALRARRRTRDRLVADGGLPLRLAYLGPLEWGATLSALAGQAIAGVEQVSGGVYRRTVIVDGEPGVLELSAGGEGELRLIAHLPRWDGLVHVVARARRIAGLDLKLAPPLEPQPGLRPIGTWDGFETGVNLIVGHSLARPAAQTAMRHLVERLGSPVPGLRQLDLSHTFPEPAVVAASDLHDLGLPRRAAATIERFAAAVIDGTLRLDGSSPLDRLLAALAALGVDELGANELALRLGEGGAHPANSAEGAERAARVALAR